jgi:hypothetical protein
MILSKRQRLTREASIAYTMKAFASAKTDTAEPICRARYAGVFWEM